MSNLQRNIKALAEETAERLGFLLIETIVRGDDHNRIIEIYIDNENGISTDDCALMSSEIGELIEKSDLIKSKYRLEVSSPGVERPLRFLKQYTKHLNRKFEIAYLENDESKKLTGRLIQIEGDDLIFNSASKEIKLNYNNIRSAKVIPSF